MMYQNGSGGADGWDDLTTYQMSDGNIIMTHITSALNNAQFVTFREVNGQHHISNSIFFETVTRKLASLTNASGVAACLMVDNDVGIGANFDDRIIADPHLTGDFHLSAGSPAIDRCSEILNNASNTELDIDGEMAPFDYPAINHGIGLLDIGADEFVDVIFSDSFE